MIIYKLKYLLALLFASVTAIIAVSQETPTIKIVDFRVDEKIDKATMHTLAQDYAYQSTNGGKKGWLWALLIIESNVDGNSLQFTTGAASDYAEKFKCDVSHWYDKLSGKWRTPSQEEKDKVRDKMKSVKLNEEKWISVDPGVLTRIKISTGQGNDVMRLKDYEPEIRNPKGEIIGHIEDGFFIANSSIARQFESGKVYRLRIEVPQYNLTIAPIAPKNPVVTNSRKTLTPKWASEVTIEQEHILTELIESMVMVEGGTLWMGAQATNPKGQNYDPDAEKEESPVHQITLSDYYIGKYEVTQEQYQAVMGNNPSYFKGDKNPVERVSWLDCQKFIQKLNQMTGLNFALPTESQWEYAARGGNKCKGYKYSGSNNIYDVGYFGYLNHWGDGKGIGLDRTHRIGQKRENELGLHDMSGNVCEWCQDCYNKSWLDQRESILGFRYTTKGGCYGYLAQSCRVSSREGTEYKENSREFLGMRLVINTDNIAHKHNLGIDIISNLKNISNPDKKIIIEKLLSSMVYVEGGTFWMGAQNKDKNEINYDPDAEKDESPVHQVFLDDYFICKYEIPQEWYNLIMNHDKSNNLKPITLENIDDCQIFIKKLNKLTGLKFSLPTEAEWEYAARGGNKSKGYKYSGSNEIDSVAIYKYSQNGNLYQKQPNELGLYNMSGNVSELCLDFYYYYSSRTITNPINKTKDKWGGTSHVLRGGDFNSHSSNCRVSFRNFFMTQNPIKKFGIRLVLKP